MSLFKQGTRSNPTELSNQNKGKQSFVRFKKKGEAGEYQENFLIYKIKTVNKKTMNYVYILNPYTLNLVEPQSDGKFEGVDDKNAMILQDTKGKLFLVIHEEGRKLTHTRTISYFEMRTALAYVPSLTEIADIDESNEYKFKIDLKEEEFIPYKIEDITLIGYPIEYIKSLIPIIKTENTELLSSELGEEIDPDTIHIKESEENDNDFQLPNLDDLI